MSVIWDMLLSLALGGVIGFVIGYFIAVSSEFEEKPEDDPFYHR